MLREVSRGVVYTLVFLVLTHYKIMNIKKPFRKTEPLVFCSKNRDLVEKSGRLGGNEIKFSYLFFLFDLIEILENSIYINTLYVINIYLIHTFRHAYTYT